MKRFIQSVHPRQTNLPNYHATLFSAKSGKNASRFTFFERFSEILRTYYGELSFESMTAHFYQFMLVRLDELKIHQQTARQRFMCRNLFMNRKAKILIVEDEESLASLMVLTLTRAGYDVEAAHTGQKAIKLATENRFDLITLDIKLPDASGFEVCSELKERHISRNTPIIFISASLFQEEIAESKMRGAVDYLTKPFSPTELVHKAARYAQTPLKTQSEGISE
jgi:CheY-like chemotaxis protein